MPQDNLQSYTLEVLDNWTKFTQSDSDQKVINLNSWEYTFEKYNDKIKTLADTYNVPSRITLVYLKNLFEWYLQKATIKVGSLFDKSVDLTYINRLYDLFHDDQMVELERDFEDALTYISTKMLSDTRIGQLDLSKAVENSLDVIFDELSKCTLEIYQKGSEIGSINSVSHSLCIFNTLVECLSVLQSQPDAVYVCYISNHNTSDGYFGFFIKNNGNIFSINERIPEAFMGQHQHGRNHRFVESKPQGIFPYELFDFSNYDYKGYARTYELKDSENNLVKLTSLSQDTYITLLIVILLLKCRFEGHTPEGEIVYSNYFLNNNRKVLTDADNKALIVKQDNQIVSAGESKINYMINKLTSEHILSGEFNKEFDPKLNPNLGYHEYGYFGDSIFIDLYGDGFQLDPNKILEDNCLKIGDSSDTIMNAEFVGTEKQLRLQIYNEARKQLANHIKAQMSEEYKRFKDKYGSVSNWWEGKISDNQDRMRDFVIQAYVNAQAENCFDTSFSRRVGRAVSVSFDSDDYYYRNNHDFYNGKPCTCRIMVRMCNWKVIEEALGEEVPKIIKGYWVDRREPGNSLLNVVDPVLQIHTPFETRGSFDYSSDTYSFPIYMYFSKSGLRKYIKDKGIVPQRKEETIHE